MAWSELLWAGVEAMVVRVAGAQLRIDLNKITDPCSQRRLSRRFCKPDLLAHFLDRTQFTLRVAKRCYQQPLLQGIK
jgi:hypothetical protein